MGKNVTHLVTRLEKIGERFFFHEKAWPEILLRKPSSQIDEKYSMIWSVGKN